jgi:isopentenyl-diphosphate delta-isomerase
VDEQDRPLGTAAKLEAHQGGGRLHRAFSVFIFDSAGRMLLQRRGAGKYHFGGLWTNACCSHPQWDEPVADAARLRLREEFGIDTELTAAFTFTYRAIDPASGLTEYEFDHVFFGRFDGAPDPDRAEIDEWRWVPLSQLAGDVKAHPERYTPWFRIALDEVLRRCGYAGGPGSGSES